MRIKREKPITVSYSAYAASLTNKPVKGMLTDIMNNPNAPINDLLNREYILDILNTDGKAFSRPWFGQLMTGPQLMAYLCQVNMWLEKYKPKIDI